MTKKPFGILRKTLITAAIPITLAAAAGWALFSGRPGMVEIQTQTAAPDYPHVSKSVRRRNCPVRPLRGLQLPGTDLEIVDQIKARYTPNSIACKAPTSDSVGEAEGRVRYFSHGSPAISGLVSAPGSYAPPYSLLDDVENLQSSQAIYHVLEYMDSLGIVVRGHDGRMVSLAQHEIREGILAADPGFDQNCVENAGEAYLLATRMVVLLVERAIEGELDIGDVASSVPQDFHELLFDRLSISLFENDSSFSPELANRMLGQLDEGQKWEFFNCLYPFVYINPSYVETARRVFDDADDPTVRSGLSRIISGSES